MRDVDLQPQLWGPSVLDPCRQTCLYIKGAATRQGPTNIPLKPQCTDLGYRAPLGPFGAPLGPLGPFCGRRRLTAQAPESAAAKASASAQTSDLTTGVQVAEALKTPNVGFRV